MPRLARIDAPGALHHVIARGMVSGTLADRLRSIVEGLEGGADEGGKPLTPEEIVALASARLRRLVGERDRKASRYFRMSEGEP